MKIGNRIWCNDDPPPQGLFEARRGREFLVTESPRGRPVGGGDGYRIRGYGGLEPPSIFMNYMIFRSIKLMGLCSKPQQKYAAAPAAVLRTCYRIEPTRPARTKTKRPSDPEGGVLTPKNHQNRCPVFMIRVRTHVHVRFSRDKNTLK
jgi:hypothetical protein